MRVFAIGLLALAALALPISLAPSVAADPGAQTLVYLIGVEPLCDLAPGACPVIAQAPNGDTIEVTGAGTFSIHPKSVTGGGTFVHKAADGNVVGEGTWMATKLLAYHTYGTEVLVTPEDDELTIVGGLIMMKVAITPEGGPTFFGVMRVTCLVGSPPPGAAEGIRLVVPGALNFNKEVSGFTVYL